ncbi:hypothetical protein ACP70R_000205 [Stipagrostis hirtigluma subsp. patula]
MAEEERRRFSNLRSVRWRVYLGILPASAADSRRRIRGDGQLGLLQSASSSSTILFAAATAKV